MNKNHEVSTKEFDDWLRNATASLRMRYGILLKTDQLSLEEATQLAWAAWQEAQKRTAQ